MPTIDVSQISGFDAMTAEEKVSALLQFQIPEQIDMSGYIPKERSEEAYKDLNDKYTELLRKSTIAEHTAMYLSLPGYDEKLARETATALADGKMDIVFENQKKASDAQEKKLRAELIKQTPVPGGAGSGNTEQANVELARRMGKAKAESRKSASEALKNYF